MSYLRNGFDTSEQQHFRRPARSCKPTESAVKLSNNGLAVPDVQGKRCCSTEKYRKTSAGGSQPRRTSLGGSSSCS
ncbi:MAG: hypothetical protein R2788_12685 [Saprospiraceae bacterium]